MEACRGRQTCAKCDEKDPVHVEKNCLKEITCANCRQDQPAHTISCDVYKKEKETLKRNMSILEARKIVGTNMGESSYASVARMANTTNQDNKYRTLVEILIQLEAKVSGATEKLHSAEFYQVSAQQQVENRGRSSVVVQIKTHA